MNLFIAFEINSLKYLLDRLCTAADDKIFE